MKFSLSILVVLALLLLWARPLKADIQEDSGAVEVSISVGGDASNDGSQSQSESHDEDEKGFYKRTLEIEGSSDEVKVHSRLRSKTDTTNVENEVEVDVEVENDRLDINLEVKIQSDNGDSKTKGNAKFRLGLFELVEYSSNDASAGYTIGAQLHQQYELGKDAWGNFDSPVKNADGTWTWSITTKDGVVSLFFKVGESSFAEGSSTVPPSAIKFDFKINNFPYKKPVGQASRLALIAKLKTQSLLVEKSKSKEDGNNGAVVLNPSDSTNVYFEWEPSVIDGSGQAVTVDVSQPKLENTDSEGSSHVVIFSFLSDNPASLLWDPVCGASGEGLDNEDSSSASHAVSASLSAIVLAALFASL